MIAPPLTRFLEDRRRAFDAGDPHASLCAFATVGTDGLPKVRTLVLREVDGGLAVFINQTSPKFSELAGGIALSTYFDTIKVQYRLAGTAEALDAASVHESWLLRPDPPKRMDWYYTTVRQQSQVVADRPTLLSDVAGLELNEPLVAPPSALGFSLNLDVVERLDLAQANGIHDRQRWRLDGGVWHQETLVP